MSLATVHSRAQNGLAADAVTVEVHLGNGLPGMSIVGLPEAAVRESRDRVKAAITNCGYKFPSTRRITVNLAPADLPKEGGRFDLPIALGILAASDQLALASLATVEVLGELSLSGEIRPIRGTLPAALKAAEAGRMLVLPHSNLAEAGLAANAQLHGTTHLAQLVAGWQSGSLPASSIPPLAIQRSPLPDLADVRGQYQARRALEVAASGGHSLLMMGPPGSGKSMLAARLPSLLPPLTAEQALEVAAVASIGSGFNPAHWGQPPYRSPHHTASGVALVGGGSSPKPGEITLAHHGVLFLDELPEFERSVLEVLREPLETGQITISRAARQADFPARFQLIAAMNPCPCGYFGEARCRCTPDLVARYRGRISGPLLDRIDLQISVPRVEHHQLMNAPAEPAETSATVSQRVQACRAVQQARQGKCNAQLAGAELDTFCTPSPPAKALLEKAMERLNLSGRAYHRILRVARTLADMASSDLGPAQIAEAVRYRELERSTGS